MHASLLSDSMGRREHRTSALWAPQEPRVMTPTGNMDALFNTASLLSPMFASRFLGGEEFQMRGNDYHLHRMNGCDCCNILI